jgi:hypothetical protein
MLSDIFDEEGKVKLMSDTPAPEGPRWYDMIQNPQEYKTSDGTVLPFTTIREKALLDRQKAERASAIEAQAPALDAEQTSLNRSALSQTLAKVPVLGTPLAYGADLASGIASGAAEAGRATVSGLLRMGNMAGVIDDETAEYNENVFGENSHYARQIEKAFPSTRDGSIWDGRRLAFEAGKMMTDVGTALIPMGALGKLSKADKVRKTAEGISTVWAGAFGAAKESEPLYKQSLDFHIAQGMSTKEAYDQAFSDYWTSFAGSAALNAIGMAPIVHFLPDTVKTGIKHRLLAAGTEGFTEWVEEGMQQYVITKDMGDALKTMSQSSDAFFLGAMGGGAFAGNGKYETTPEHHEKAFVKDLIKGVEIGGTKDFFKNGNQYRVTKTGRKDWDVKVVDESPSLFKQMPSARFEQSVGEATTFTLNTGNSYTAQTGQTLFTRGSDGSVSEITIGTSPYEEVGGANGSVTFSPAQVVAMTVNGTEVVAQDHDVFDAAQQEYAKALGKEYTTPELSTRDIKQLFNAVSDIESRANEAELVTPFEPYQFLEPHMDFEAAQAEKHDELINEQAQEIAAGMTPVERAPYPVRIITPSGTVIPFAPSKSGLSLPKTEIIVPETAVAEAGGIELVENEIDTSAAKYPPIETKLGANNGRSLDTISPMKFGTKPAPVKPLKEGRDAKGRFARKAKPMPLEAPADLKMKKPVNSLFPLLGHNMEVWADENGKFKGVEVRSANGQVVMDTKMYYKLKEDIAAGVTPTLKRRIAAQSVLSMEELDTHVEALNKGEINPQEIVAKKYLDAGLISEYTADPNTKNMKITFNPVHNESSLSFSFSQDVQMLANMAASFEFAAFHAGAVATASGGVASLTGAEFNKRFLNPNAKRAEIESKIKEAAIRYNWTTPRLKDGKEQLSEDGKVIMYTPEEAADYLNRLNWAMAEGMALRQKVDPNKLYEVAISDVQLADSFVFGTPNDLFQLTTQAAQDHVSAKGFMKTGIQALLSMPKGTMLRIGPNGLPLGNHKMFMREETAFSSAFNDMYKLDNSLTNNIKGRLKYEAGQDLSVDDYLAIVFDAAQLTELTVEDARAVHPNPKKNAQISELYRAQEEAYRIWNQEGDRVRNLVREKGVVEAEHEYSFRLSQLPMTAQLLEIPNNLKELSNAYFAAERVHQEAMAEVGDDLVMSFDPQNKFYHIKPSPDGGDFNAFLKGGGLENLHKHGHNMREDSTNLGWIRFSVDKAAREIIIDEIQSDVFAGLNKLEESKKVAKEFDLSVPNSEESRRLTRELDRLRYKDTFSETYKQEQANPTTSLLKASWQKSLLHKIVQEAAMNGYSIGIVDPSVIKTRVQEPSKFEAIEKSYGVTNIALIRDVLSTYDPAMKNAALVPTNTTNYNSDAHEEIRDQLDAEMERVRAAVKDLPRVPALSHTSVTEILADIADRNGISNNLRALKATIEDFREQRRGKQDYSLFTLTPQAIQAAQRAYNASAGIEGTVLFAKEKGKPLGSFNTHTKVVKFFQGSNLHTGLHEMGHAWRYAMKGQDLEKARVWAHKEGNLPKGKKWTVSGEEKFANAFMSYALHNKNVQPQFKGLFSELRQFLISLGQNVKPVVQFSDEMDNIMGNMLMAEINAQTPKVRKAIYDERRDLFQFDERADYSKMDIDSLDDLLKMLGVEYTASKVDNDETMAEAELKYRNADYMADLERRLRAGEDVQQNRVDVAIQQLMVKEVLAETIAKFNKPMSAKARAKATAELREAFADDLVRAKQSGTSAGRALQAFKMQGVKNRLILSQHMISGLLTEAEKHAVQAAYKKGEPSDKFVHEIMNPQGKKILWELYYMGLLSSPQTLGVNTVGTLVWSSLWQPVHVTASGAVDAVAYRAAKSGIFTKTVRDWYYNGGPVQRQRYASEVFPVLAGYKKLPKALRTAWELQTKGYSSSEIVSNMELELHTINMETGSRYKLPSERAAGEFNTAGNVLRKTMFHAGTLMRFMRASDAVFSSLAYESSIGRQAYRIGQQQGKTALEAKKIAAERMAEPTKEMQAEALAEARYNTFTDAPGAVMKNVMGIRETPYIGVPARLLLPFVSTPMNLFKRGMEMVPGLGLVVEAGHRAGKNPTEVGHTGSDILAKQMEGVMIAAMLAAYLMGGDDDGMPLFTGPAPDEAGQRKRFYEQGKQPWSIRVKDTWYSYRFAEPFNTPLMILGALLGEVENGKAQESTVEEHLTRMTDALEVIVNGSFMRNFEAITSDDDKKVQKMVANRLGGMVPFNGMFRFIAQMLNKVNNEGNQVPRELDGFISQAVGSNIGGFALEMSIAYKKPEYIKFWSDLGVKEDVLLTTWGEPVVYNSQSMWLFWNPIKTKPAVVDDVERELAKLTYYPSMPEREIDVNGKQVELDSDIYVQYLLSAGKQAKERMARLIKTPYYQRLEVEDKAALFQKEVGKARDVYRKKAGQEQAKRLRSSQRTL